MNLNYMQCEHFTTHWRMKSYAYDMGGKHIVMVKATGGEGNE